ncbi:acyltransferase [Mucilaginibacter sp. SP1R1]|uniref:acyltransferase n=1 Tax=Mucilaginibacter sp. SP1R1 TaxID=2723091 RepID=UPI001615E326|nr:acyltransferase [Mucilaginibacter sp. SP1R1]MBB6149560.1 galactoside O-acetyltransferase [Mucilaginibacter sp. SP1R1]
MIGFIVRKVKGILLARHISGASKYIIRGNSHFFESFRLTVIKPVQDKIYLKVGDDCILDCKVLFESGTGEVIIGNRCYIGTSSIISRNKIEFGNDVMVAMGSVFYDHDSHSINYLNREDDITRQLEDHRSGKFFIENKSWNNVTSSPIKIGNNAWIGINCIILKGVTIGEGAIIGAGSVVTRDIPAWTVAGGNPAKVIKEIPDERRRK